MELAFNELSLHNLPASTALADMAMNEFIIILNELKKQNKKDVFIRTNYSLSEISIAENYHIKQWLTKNKMLASIFLTAITAKPIIRDYPYYLYNGQECQGFAFAHENDRLSISYNPHNEWDNDNYELERQFLEEEDLSYTKDFVKILHVSKKAHVNGHQAWIARHIKLRSSNLLANIANGLELWNQKEMLFSHLIFCESVKSQISSISLKDANLATCVNKLLILNDYLTNIDKNAFDYTKIGIAMSGESQVTLDTYSQERTFQCSDGQDRVFELHIKLASWRIYIFHVPNENKCWVGYIGKHLRTQKYK